MEKLTRCGACGEFQQDPSLYSKEEQDNAELIHCWCENKDEHVRITRDMAIDAGCPEMEGEMF